VDLRRGHGPRRRDDRRACQDLGGIGLPQPGFDLIAVVAGACGRLQKRPGQAR
jgi:hypothetical protein